MTSSQLANLAGDVMMFVKAMTAYPKHSGRIKMHHVRFHLTFSMAFWSKLTNTTEHAEHLNGIIRDTYVHSNHRNVALTSGLRIAARLALSHP
jgi:hypothetical protein